MAHNLPPTVLCFLLCALGWMQPIYARIGIPGKLRYIAERTTPRSTVLLLPAAPHVPRYTHVELEYRVPGLSWTLVGRTPVGQILRSAPIQVPNLVPGMEYQFRMRYVNGYDSSPFGNVLTLTTPAEVVTMATTQPTGSVISWPSPIDLARQSPTEVILQLPSVQGSGPKATLAVLVRFQEYKLWSPWVQVTKVSVSDMPTEVRVGGLKPHSIYQFRLRIDRPDTPPLYSTVFTYTTPKKEIRRTPRPIPAPRWPRPPTLSVAPQEIILNIPAAISGSIYELFKQTPSGQYSFLQSYTSSVSRQQRLPVLPNTQYRLYLRAVNTATRQKSGFSDPLLVRTPPDPTTPPVLPTPPPVPVWPIPATSRIRSTNVILNIPGSPTEVHYNLILQRANRYIVVGSFPSRRVKQLRNVRATPGTTLRLFLRAFDPESGLWSSLSSVLVISVPPVTLPTTATTPQPTRTSAPDTTAAPPTTADPATPPTPVGFKLSRVTSSVLTLDLPPSTNPSISYDLFHVVSDSRRHFLTRFPSSRTPSQGSVPVRSGTRYHLILRAVNAQERPSGFTSPPLVVNVPEAPIPEAPDFSLLGVTPNTVRLHLPASKSQRPLLYRILRVFPDGREEFIHVVRASSHPKDQTLPVAPGTMYWFTVRAMDGQTQRVSPRGRVITVNVPEWPTTPSPTAMSPPPVPTLVVYSMSPRMVTFELPGSARLVTYQIFRVLPDGRRRALRQILSSASQKKESVGVIPGTKDQFTARAIDKQTGFASSFSSVLTVDVPELPTTPAPTTQPVLSAPVISEGSISSHTVSLNLPKSTHPVVFQIFQVFLDGRRHFLRESRSSTTPTQVTISVTPGTVYHFTARSVDRVARISSLFSDTLMVNVPVQQRTQEYKVGDTVAVLPTSPVSPPCNWNRENGSLDTTRMFPLANGSLLILNTKIHDEGIYLCRLMTSGNRTRLAPLHVRLVVPPVQPTVSVPRQLTVSNHTNVTIICNATGHPPPLVKWERIQEGQTIHLTSNPVLKLQNVATNTTGTYQCTASNAGGSDVAGTDLVVQSCPAQLSRVSKIVGGLPAHTAEWQVLIWRKPSCQDDQPGRLLCGGVLIKKRFVLTAAHCILNKFFPTKFEFMRGVVVKVGKTRLFTQEQFEQTRNIDRVRIHPNYDPVSLDNDIALLRLQRGVHLNQENHQHISLISLPKNDTHTCFERPGTNLRVTGYGLTSSHPPIVSDNLRYATMPLTNLSQCRESYPNFAITDAMLCGGDGLGQVDSCRGDSGGPAVAFNSIAGKWQLVGLTSWGEERCARHGAYAVLTRVSSFVNWIQTSVHLDRGMPPEVCQ